MIDLSFLNPSQYVAATSSEKEVMILAGAGTGKTATLISRVAYLIDLGVDPNKILLLTFTNKAADEMVARATRMIGQAAEKITACTYHSFCNMMLRKYGAFIKLSQDYIIITPNQVTDILKMLKTEDKSVYSIKGFPRVESIASVYSYAINCEKTLDEAIDEKIPRIKGLSTEGFIRDAIHTLKNRYKEYKEEHCILDYDDLLLKMIELLDDNVIGNVIRSLYNFIMVDEYQDTNNVQEKILSLMHTDRSNLTVVGDDYQSIYKFRGSNVNHFLNFTNLHPNCRLIKLEDNYRSTQEILDLSNTIMNRNVTWYDDKNMLKILHTGKNANGCKPVYHTTDNIKEEADYIYDEIMKLNAQGIPFHEISVIYRNSASSAHLESLFKKNNINYAKYGGVKFFDRVCIQDMMALFTVLTNPYQEISWFRILSLLPEIGEIRAREISSACTYVNGNNFLLTSKYANRKTNTDNIIQNALERMYNSLMNIAVGHTYDEQLELCKEYYIALRQDALDRAKFKDDESEQEARSEFENDKESVDILVDIAREKNNMIAFIDSITLVAAKEPEDGSAITMTTVHSAKGLEWDTVFLMDCVEGAFPSNKSLDDQEELDEELRCFYVAITRAKNRLYLLRPREYYLYGEKLPDTPSRFLKGTASYVESK